MKRTAIHLVRCIVLLHLSVYAQAQTDAVCELNYDAVSAEDSIALIAWHHEIKSPEDAAQINRATSEQAMFTVSKSIDDKTPAFMRAHLQQSSGHMTVLCDYGLSTGEASGTTEPHYFSIELVNASIAEIRTEMLNNKYSENMPHRLREHITFTYQDIGWKFRQN